MGEYTKLDCEAILKDKDVEIFHRLYLKEKKNQEFENPYNHDFFNEKRAWLFKVRFNRFEGNTLKLKFELKNYENETDKFFDFLKSIDTVILRFNICINELYGDEIKNYYGSDIDVDDEKDYYVWYNYLTEEKLYEEIPSDDDWEIWMNL